MRTSTAANRDRECLRARRATSDGLSPSAGLITGAFLNDPVERPPREQLASTDRAVKVPINARENVGYVWLVDPLLQTLEVLRLDGPGYRLAGVWRGDAVVQAEPFEAVSVRLADLWSA